MERRPAGMKKSWMMLCAAGLLWGAAGLTAEPGEDAQQARALFERGDYAGALPFYERLAAADVANTVYAERLASCLTAKVELLPAGEEREALIVRALAEARRARALGNNSSTVQYLLDRLQDDAVHAPGKDEALFRDAEIAFGKGDYDTALAGYKAIAAADPSSYRAHLFAGDVYFRKSDLAGAAEWFGKAIAIDPNTETAYRYWADAIAKSGDDKAALPYYIRAVVAEPYQRLTWNALQTWAQRNGARLQSPQLPRPQVSLQDNGKGKGPQSSINIDPKVLSDKRAGAAWLAYAMSRTMWMQGEYLERNPDAGGYRHSLQEEVVALKLAVVVIDKDRRDVEQLPALRDLVRLARDDMLEPYVLLNAADDGIAQDYAAYRDAHREQLERYIDQYMVVRKPAE